MRGLRAWVGFRQTGVPYVRPERMFGTSTNSSRRTSAGRVAAILSFSYAPLDLITWLAFVTVGAVARRGLGAVVLRCVDPTLAPKGFTTLILVILFLGGIQLLCLAIIGSYLAHVYEEVKRRPPYVVESVINPPRSGTRPDVSDAALGRGESTGDVPSSRHRHRLYRRRP